MRGSDVGVLGHDDAQLIRNTGVSVSPLGEDTEEDGMTLGELFDILVGGCGRFLGVVFLYGQPLACSVSYRAFPSQRLFDPRMVVPTDALAGEAAGLLARTLLPMPGDARTRVFMRPKDPSAAGVVAGCTPSRSWTGPGRAGPSGPAIPATGNGIRGRRETAGRSSARSVAAARTRHRVAPVPRSATSRPCAPLPCRRGSRSSGKGRPCRHGP